MRGWRGFVVAVMLGGCGVTQEQEPQEVEAAEVLDTPSVEAMGCCSRDCPDGTTISCCHKTGGYCLTTDAALICDGVSYSCPVPTSPGCTINGVTYAAGDVNPSNPCLVCDPNQSTTAWSNNDNFVNNNGFCWQDSGLCSSGFCKGWSCLENGDCGGHCIDGQRVCGF